MATEKTHDYEPPAARARRLRIYKFLRMILILCSAATVVTISVKYKLYSDENYLVAIISIIFGPVFFWSALWQSNVPCPRCGWNIYMKKQKFPIPQYASRVPSTCPNCGLDLEVAYPSGVPR